MKVLLSNPEAERARWLEMRKGKISASVAAAVLGEDPNLTPLGAWLRITGREEPMKDNSRLKAGRRFERPTAEWWAEEREAELMPSPGLIAHEKHDWLVGTPDFMYRAGGQDGVLEVKNYSDWAKDEWLSGVPLPQMTQLQLYLEMCGLERGEFAVCFGQGELIPFTVIRDDNYVGTAIEALEAWKHLHLDRDDPPPAVGRTGEVRALARLHPSENGERVVFDDSVAAAAVAMEQARRDRLEAEKTEEQLKAIVVQAIGDASFGVMPDGTGYHWQYQEVNYPPQPARTVQKRVLIRRKKL